VPVQVAGRPKVAVPPVARVPLKPALRAVSCVPDRVEGGAVVRAAVVNVRLGRPGRHDLLGLRRVQPEAHDPVVRGGGEVDVDVAVPGVRRGDREPEQPALARRDDAVDGDRGAARTQPQHPAAVASHDRTSM
jgi:hypothetical protein